MDEPIYGIYRDDGTKIDPESIVKPGLCLSCKKDEGPGEDVLCLLIRADQHKGKEFQCHAFESKEQKDARR